MMKSKIHSPSLSFNYARHKRVEIRGKRGRLLVLKPPEASINLIIKVLSNVGVNSTKTSLIFVLKELPQIVTE